MAIKNGPTVIIVSPTESELTSRGKRHPELAELLVRKGLNVRYLSTSFDHSAKTLFSDEEQKTGKSRIPYILDIVDVGMYRKNLSFARLLWNRRIARKAYDWLVNHATGKDVIIVPSDRKSVV